MYKDTIYTVKITVLIYIYIIDVLFIEMKCI